MTPKTITIECQACGYKLKDYPVRGPTLPHRCPNCGASEPFKEYRPVLYLPMRNLIRRI